MKNIYNKHLSEIESAWKEYLQGNYTTQEELFRKLVDPNSDQRKISTH